MSDAESEDDEPIEPSRPTTSGNTDNTENEDSDEGGGRMEGGDNQSDDSSTDSSQSLTEEQLLDIQIANTKQMEQEIDVMINKQTYLFDKLYHDYDFNKCKDISAKCRRRNNFSNAGLAYAEIKYSQYAEIFCQLYQHGLEREGLAGKFVDIGSGTGKAVFATALLHDFKWIVGIEILDDLVEISNTILSDRWKQFILNGEIKEVDKRQIDIKFVCGDASYIPWQDGDVVFMNATSFGEKLRASLTAVAEKMRKDSLLISVTHPLNSKMFECVLALKMDVSWGSATAYVYKKTK